MAILTSSAFRLPLDSPVPHQMASVKALKAPLLALLAGAKLPCRAVLRLSVQGAAQDGEQEVGEGGEGGTNGDVVTFCCLCGCF